MARSHRSFAPCEQILAREHSAPLIDDDTYVMEDSDGIFRFGCVGMVQQRDDEEAFSSLILAAAAAEEFGDGGGKNSNSDCREAHVNPAVRGSSFF